MSNQLGADLINLSLEAGMAPSNLGWEWRSVAWAESTCQRQCEREWAPSGMNTGRGYQRGSSGRCFWKKQGKAESNGYHPKGLHSTAGDGEKKGQGSTPGTHLSSTGMCEGTSKLEPDDRILSLVE